MASLTSAYNTCPGMTLFSMLVSSFVTKVVNENRTDSDIPPYSTYDFIVVGGGSGGSVMASRLSENPKWKVLLLESGCSEILFEDTPVFYLPVIDRACMWSYDTVPHRNMNGGRPVPIENARALGGTSSINAMFYVRGNKRDYDAWAARGNPGWDYESVLPYFKKAENMTDSKLALSKYHSTNGPLTVSVYDYEDDRVAKGVMKAFEETLELPQIDVNGANQIGSSFLQYTMKDGQRCSTKRAYLDPARTRSNLLVKTYSHVTRVLIDKVSRRATGVEVVNQKGLKTIVYASKEVIVSGGAIRSPQLLMLSGIGPADHLKSLGIEVVQDLPVGKNLQDHVVVLPLFPIVLDIPRSAPIKRKRKPGPSPLRPSQFMTAFKSFRSGDPSWPDMQFEVSKVLDTDGCIGVPENSLFNRVFITPSLLHAKSVGEVRLADANPFSKPKVDPRYLSRYEDVELLRDAMKFLLRLNNSRALKEAGIRFKGLPPSFCCQKSNCIDDEKYWECVIRTYSSTAYHPYGSCRMGPDTDPEAVVDPQLRVKGISNLRVVDASTLTTISGNLNAPIIMMAEKASALIRQDWKSSTKRKGRKKRLPETF